MERLNVIGTQTEEFKRFMSDWEGGSQKYVVAHTSGSTGTPKPIKLLKKDMMVSARRTCSFFGLNESSLLALPLSVDYIAGKMMVCRAIECGATLWIEKPSRNLLSEFDGESIDLLAIVTAQVDSVIKVAKRIKINNLIIGGAPLAERDERKLLENGLNSFVTYGMTETCSHVALRRTGESLYNALPGISFDVDCDNCLIINCPDMSINSISTNDIVRLVDPYSFEWVGRRDNVINSGGIKLHPEMIEAKIRNVMPSPFYITSRKSQTWGEEIILVVESEKPVIEKNIIEKLLNGYERPKEIIYISKFDRTNSGKIVRKRF